jgi:hypothetical protein
MKHPPTTSHNYEPKVTAALLLHGIKPGKMIEAQVRHESWCDARKGKGFCNCDCQVYLFSPTEK